MRLYEYEGKHILATHGIALPRSVIVDTADFPTEISFPVVLKAQTLFGNRKEQGLIQFADTKEEYEAKLLSLLKQSQTVLVEEKVDFQSEYYAALRYDTTKRHAIFQYAHEGGSGIEGRHESMVSVTLPCDGHMDLPADCPFDTTFLKQLTDAFFNGDCLLIEINPLVQTSTGTWMALDAKVELDDTAAFRQPEWEKFPPRSLFSRAPTPMELQAKQINAMDTRGVAGASFFEFDGTIGILASGGGASLVAMDGLMAAGLQPANYTEYSGNPMREKVAALSSLVLSKPNLEALWVIGGNANFTDIFETLAGVMDAIEAADLPEGFPIVIRRGGPRWEEAFTHLTQRTGNTKAKIQLFGPDFPMLETTGVLVKAVQEYRDHT